MVCFDSTYEIYGKYSVLGMFFNIPEVLFSVGQIFSVLFRLVLSHC